MCIKKLLLPVLLFLPFLGMAQSLLTYPVFGMHSMLSWPAIETKMPRALITRFINMQPHNFMAYRDTGNHFENIDSLYTHLHFLDLNNDARNDVIFEGQSSGEGGQVSIFINTGNGYKQVFDDRQGVTKIDWDAHKIKRLYVEDWGCCADYVEFKKIYDVSFDNNIPSFALVSQAAAVFSESRPDSILSKPFRFEVLNDDYNLRALPVIDDSSAAPWQENDSTKYNTGNVLGKISAGAQGLALGKATDATGREWWYIELDENTPLKKSVFYDNDNKFPTKIRGWISSRFAKALSQ